MSANETPEPVPAYLRRQEPAKLLEWARENRAMAQMPRPPCDPEDLLRWAEELEGLAAGMSKEA